MALLEAVLWLSMNVYHEARSEDMEGKLAVAHVTMNRARQEHKSIKKIVKAPAQFSWTEDKLHDPIEDPQAFAKCVKAVYVALKQDDFTEGATFYHKVGIKPGWSKAMQPVGVYGTHLFYKEKEKNGRTNRVQVSPLRG